MNPREQTLAAVLTGMIVLAVGGAAAYLLVLQPLGEKTRTADKLDADLEKARAELAAARKDAPRLAVAKKRSLPADPAVARREYSELLSRVLQKAGVAPGYKVAEKTPDPAGIPLLPGPGKKATYQKVAFDVTFERADMWNVKDVLEGYYKLNVLHQITHFEAKVDATPGQTGKAKAGDRRDLMVKFTTEAIILDGAEPRRTLLPVSPAFAAAGGWLGYDAVALNSEVGRGLTPLQLAQVLAPTNRDYRLLIQKDPFHGPLPPPPPLSIGKIADVAVKVGEKIEGIRIPLTGDLAFVGKVAFSAVVEGGPLKGTEVKIDENRKMLTLAPKAGETGTGKVTVVAKGANGQTAERSFSVKIDEATPKEDVAKVPPKEDIATEIVLIGVSVRSDGTASAIVKDNYNPYTYEFDAGTRRVKVLQFEYFGQRKKQVKSYRPDVSEFEIDDYGTTATKRHFKVVAIDDGGLVLEDLKPAPADPKAADPKKGGPPVKGAPPMKGGPPAKAAPPAASPADGLAALAGPAAVGRPKATGPLLYRWAPGRSLAALAPVPPAEARRILERSAALGPVGAALAPTEPVAQPVRSDDPIAGPGS